MHPKGIALFNENLIRLFHERAKQDLVYVDATGRVVLGQGFSNFWSYGAHEEIDHNFRSPTINF